MIFACVAIYHIFTQNSTPAFLKEHSLLAQNFVYLIEQIVFWYFNFCYALMLYDTSNLKLKDTYIWIFNMLTDFFSYPKRNYFGLVFR